MRRKREFISIPIFNYPLNSAGDNLAGLLRMPIHTGHGSALFPTSLDLVIHLARLPVPETDESTAVAGRDELSVRGNDDIDGISGVVVAPKAFLTILSELVGGCIHHNL